MNARDLLAAATPRPWRWQMAEAQGLQRRIPLVVVGGDDQIIAGRVAPFQAIAETGFDAPETNAALIVAAVNEYEAHVDLEEMLREFVDGDALSSAAIEDAFARLDAARSAT